MPTSRLPRAARATLTVASLAGVALVVGACSTGTPTPSTPAAAHGAPTPPTASAAPATAAAASTTGAQPTAAGSPASRAAGTVKIHDGNTESEGPANDPKVCQFHIHFFLGAGTSGTWRIDTQPGGQTVLDGTWDSGSAPDVRVPPAPDLFSLPDGQYKLSWSQAGQSGGDKQKVFKVDCAAASALPSGPASPAPSSTGGPSATPEATATVSAPPSGGATPTPTAPASVDPETTPSPSPSAPPTVPPSPSVRPTPTAPPSGEPEATPLPSDSARPTTSPIGSARPTPTGSVGGERTASPGGGGSGSAPDTSTAPVPSVPAGIDWTILLAGLAGLAAGALAVPTRSRRG